MAVFVGAVAGLVVAKVALVVVNIAVVILCTLLKMLTLVAVVTLSSQTLAQRPLRSRNAEFFFVTIL